MWWRFIPISPVYIPLARTRFKLKATGKENVPVKGPFIIITNHQTVYDAFAIGLAIPWTIYRNRIIPWAKVDIGRGAEGKAGQFLYKWLRAIPIQRNEGDEMEETIRSTIKHLKRRELIMIFPEGTRQKYGRVAPFQYGAANLARIMPVPILPVGVYRRRDDRGMQVHYGKPFYMPDLDTGQTNHKNACSPEEKLCLEIDSIKRHFTDAGFGREAMRSVAKQVRIIAKRISMENIDLNRFSKMAGQADNDFLRERIIESLPEGWEKIEHPIEED